MSHHAGREQGGRGEGGGREGGREESSSSLPDLKRLKSASEDEKSQSAGEEHIVTAGYTQHNKDSNTILGMIQFEVIFVLIICT